MNQSTLSTSNAFAPPRPGPWSDNDENSANQAPMGPHLPTPDTEAIDLGVLGLSGSGFGIDHAGRNTLINNPILTKQWESTTSPWTNKGGFTSGAEDTLTRNGLTVSSQIHPTPVGGVVKSPNTSIGIANNINGSLAESATVNRWNSVQGAIVTEQVPIMNGSRIIDVRVDIPNADPRFSERIDIESKLGRVSANNNPDSRFMTQVLNDASDLADNRVLRQAGTVLQKAGRVVRPVGIVLDAIQVGSAFRADGNQIGENTGRAASSLAGGAAGGYGGALAGAAIGTAIFPGVGTVIGGLVGGIGGAFAGDQVGRSAFDTVRGWFK